MTAVLIFCELQSRSLFCSETTVPQSAEWNLLWLPWFKYRDWQLGREIQGSGSGELSWFRAQYLHPLHEKIHLSGDSELSWTLSVNLPYFNKQWKIFILGRTYIELSQSTCWPGQMHRVALAVSCFTKFIHRKKIDETELMFKDWNETTHFQCWNSLKWMKNAV